MSTTARKHNEKQSRENQRGQLAGWNCHLALCHTKESTEAASEESHWKTAQQKLARQQAQ
jgi:hypothetical protein